MKTRKRALRIVVALAVLVVAVASAHFGGALPVGTLCLACPVGFAQIAAASQSIPWHLLPGVLAVLAIVFLLGRVFCSWVCPSQLLKNVFGGHTPRGLYGRGGEACEEGAPTTCEEGTSATSDAPSRKTSGCSACAKGAPGIKTQGIVLAVLLVVSFAVGFPVFCLLCPIGLVFGTLWALNRVFVLLQPGWELIVFPLMLLAELFLFKRWCAAICPLGFFFGLVEKARTKLGFGVRPQASCATCISSEGCRTCSTVCPENIDVATADAPTLEACTLCGDCLENCPTKSIKLAFGASKSAPKAPEAPVAVPASDEDLASKSE
ncbi:4Fe-4S binding protein [Gordonibacter massiliensis (ex Traore et al. 2017)]|uniref:4Fe-4S binding protein n=1 Tax=Gordonibacter massiliensis (ex Traore et al. 2017) TaxID=1841863 RepID=UPI001C8B89B9|nr:4Fe-4S binding protein [Gordonibacter massiliensis (ex Traore et al. 2017)]MBX9032498.1 4Fe-4S binding protein [Gordonibacter massiliensis (ex Traore et al. 2017)]